MQWVANYAARRLELRTADGRVLAVYLAQGGSRDGLPADVVTAEAPEAIAAAFDQALAGGGQETLTAELGVANAQVQADIRNAGSRSGSQVRSVMPEVAQINAGTQMASTAIDIMAAAKKLEQDELLERQAWLSEGLGQAPFNPVAPVMGSSGMPVSIPGGLDDPELRLALAGIGEVAAKAVLAARAAELNRVKTQRAIKADWSKDAAILNSSRDLEAEIDEEEAYLNRDPKNDKDLNTGGGHRQLNPARRDLAASQKQAAAIQRKYVDPGVVAQSRKQELQVTPAGNFFGRYGVNSDADLEYDPVSMEYRPKKPPVLAPPPPLSGPPPPQSLRFAQGGMNLGLGEPGAPGAQLGPASSFGDESGGAGLAASNQNQMQSHVKSLEVSQQMRQALEQIAQQEAEIDADFARNMADLNAQMAALQQQFAGQRTGIQAGFAGQIAQNPYLSYLGAGLAVPNPLWG